MTTWTAKAHLLREAQATIFCDVLMSIDPNSQQVQEIRYSTTLAGDERKLRGIPAIGRGVTGAIPGTSPHSIRP